MSTETVEETNAPERRPYQLTSAELAATIEKIEKINTRAEKRGWTGRFEVDATPVSYWTFETFDGDGGNGTLVATRPDGSQGSIPTRRGVPIPGMWVETVEYDVFINGEAPCYAGWTFIATLDWDPSAGLIVRTAPGVESVNREGLIEGYCGHCKKTRNRRKTMLVLNTETGEQVQIGTSCINDFLGWTGRPVFIYEDDIRKEVEDSWGGVARVVDYGTRTALAVAWAAIKLDGFVSSKSWDKMSTRTAVSIFLGRSNDKAAKALREQLGQYLDDSAYDRADAVRAFIASDDFSGTSEFVLNLKAIAAADYVSPKNLGFLCFAPEAQARHLEQTLIKARKAEIGADSDWVGTVHPEGATNAKGKKLPKDRRVITGTLVGIKYMGLTQVSYYNVVERVLYTVLDDDGNIIKLWNSYPEGSKGIFGDEEGVRVTFKASIKSHDTYKDRKETTVERPANVEITPAEAAK